MLNFEEKIQSLVDTNSMLNKNLNRAVDNASLEDKLDKRILKNID